MTTIAESLNRAFEWVLLPRGARALLAQQLILLIVVVAVVCLAGPLVSLAGAVALAVGIAALLGPSRPVILIFVLFMGFTHQYRSFFTIQAGGVEWHPRELVLLVLLAHCGVKLLRQDLRLSSDLLHFFIAIVALFFAQTAVVGLLTQHDLHRVVSEVRPPLFLLTYVVLVLLVRPRDLRPIVRVFAAATLLLALGAIAFFAYTVVTRNIVNTQNVLGEFMQHMIGPALVQSVRPAGHMYYEVALVVLISMCFCPAVSRRERLLYIGCIGILCAAIAITIMRTAFVSVFASVCVLAYLSLPGARLRVGVAWCLAIAAVLVLAVFSFPLYDILISAVPKVGVSIQARFVEMQGAYRLFSEHPLLGAGMGSTFEAMGLVAKTSQVAYAQQSYQTVHNVWMYYLFKGGVCGFLLIAVGLGGVFVEMARRIPSIRDPRERFFLRGLTAAYGAQLVATLAMPRLLYPKGYVFLAMAAAYAVILVAKQRDRSACGDDSRGR